MMDKMEGVYWLRVRAALGLEIKSGLRNSKGSLLEMLRGRGITKARTKKQAWIDLNDWMAARGLPKREIPWKR